MDNARAHCATQQDALVVLFQLLLWIAAGVLGVATLTALCLSAAEASDRVTEMSVRRAVGASRWHVIGGSLLEASMIAGVGLIAGGACGLVAGRLAMAAWPHETFAGSPVANLVAIVASLAGVVVGALLPVALPHRNPPSAWRWG